MLPGIYAEASVSFIYTVYINVVPELQIIFFSTMVFVWVTSSKVDITPSVPIPEYLYPPKGI